MKREKWNREKIISRISHLQKNNIPLNSGFIQNRYRALYLASCRHFGSWTEALAAIGVDSCKVLVRKKWNKQKTIDEILERKKANKPLNSNVIQNNDKKLMAAALKYFGDWNSAIKASGLDIDEIRKPNKNWAIGDMKELAERKGGKCLSEKYINAKTYMKWQCADGHVWTAKHNCIRRSWCPYCSRYLSEEKCRFIFEELTGEKFQRTRKILGKGFELDGYCKDLKTAFEYQGQQHYYFVKYFHKTREKLDKIKERDKYKIKRCKELKVSLIVIPYTVFDNSNEVNFIFRNLQLLNVKTICNVEDFSYDGFINSKLLSIKKIVKEKGGKLISNFYAGSSHPIIIECKRGHMHSTTWDILKQGHWCAKCGYLDRYKKAS